MSNEVNQEEKSRNIVQFEEINYRLEKLEKYKRKNENWWDSFNMVLITIAAICIAACVVYGLYWFENHKITITPINSEIKMGIGIIDSATEDVKVVGVVTNQY
jgi:cell shape-determining protein MreC